MQLKQLQNSLFLLTLFLLPTQLGKHTWPVFAIVHGMRVDYLSPTLYVTDITIMLLCAVWIIQQRKYVTKNVQLLVAYLIPAYSLDASMLLSVFLLLIVNTIVSVSPLVTVLGIMKLVECFFFGWYSCNVWLTNKNKTAIVITLLSALLLQSLLAIAQYINHGSIGGPLYFLGERTFSSDTPGIANASINGALVLRPYGTLPHPNVLAGLILVFGSILLNEVKTLSSVVKKLVYSSMILVVVAFFLTLSRLPIFLGVLCVSIAGIKAVVGRFIALQRYTNKQLQIITVATSSILVGLGLLITSPVLPRFLSSSLFEESIVQRETLSNSALHILADHPFIGTGLHTFLLVLPKYVTTTQTIMLLQPVHNIVLLIAAETGLAGELLMVYFLSRLTLRSLRSGWSHTLPLLIILLLGMVDHYWLTVQQGQLLFAFTIAYSAALPAQQ